MPIIDLQRQMRELGRIRIGRKNDRNQPERLDTFRLTSTSKPLLDSAAELYGGTVAEWNDSPGAARQYELVTEQPSIPVAVPPGQSLSQWYEMWSGGGCQRRCDGEQEIISEQPCICLAKGQAPEERDCKPTTRLNVMLPELWDIGVWRLETHGWYAAVELGGIVPLLEAATSRNVALNARIRIDQRTVKKAGEKHPRHFGVPIIEVAESLGGLLTQAGMLKPTETPSVALPEPEEAPQLPAPSEPAPVQGKPTEALSPAQELAMRMRKLGLTDGQRAGFVSWFTAGDHTGLSDLDASVLGLIADVVTAIEQGKYELHVEGEQAWATEKQQAEPPVMAVQEAGGYSADEFKAAMTAAKGVGQATLIRQARSIAEAFGLDPNTITSVAALSKAPVNLQSEVMDWLKKGQ